MKLPIAAALCTLFLVCIIACAVLLVGCAALPQFMQPTDATSQEAEGTWLVLDTIDTLQTVQIAKNPSCFHEADGIADRLYGGSHPSVGRVLAINIPLMLAHTAVASWLDDEVNAHLAADAATPGLDSVGPWYVGRLVFHTVSIGASSYAVLNNFSHGIRPWSSNCP